MTPSRRAVLQMLAIVLAGRGAHASSQHEPLWLGAFPYMPPLALERVFAPVQHAFSIALRRPVLMRTTMSFEAFEAALEAHDFDVAFVHPFLATLAIDELDYWPLARVDKPFELVFLARSDEPRLAMDGLRGGTVLVPPRRSAAAALAAITLSEHGLRPDVDVELVPTASKMACLDGVLRREALCCAIPTFALAQLGFDDDPRLATFHVASLATGLSMVAGRSLDMATVDGLTREICSWSWTEDGRRLLDHTGWPGFVSASHADYAQVRGAKALLANTNDRS